MTTLNQNAMPNAKSARSPVSRTFKAIFNNWILAREMAKRELMVSNKGALLGIAWLLIRPFIQVGAMVVVVTFVFGVRFEQVTGRFGYAVYVLAGMVPWQILSKVFEEAPSLVRDRVEVLKQVVYPLEILPVTSILSAMIGPSIAFVVYLLLAAFDRSLHSTVLLLPVPLTLLILFLVGTAWALMMLGVLLKDLREIISVFLGLLVYMSPVVMSEQMAGPRIWSLLQFNPFFHVIATFRDVFDGTFHPISWIIFASMTIAALALGIFVLDRARAILNELI